MQRHIKNKLKFPRGPQQPKENINNMILLGQYLSQELVIKFIKNENGA